MPESYRRILRSIKRLKGPYILYNNSKFLDFTSNDYLGISNNPIVLENTLQQLNTAQHYGATSSRLLGGNHDLYEVLEKKLAHFLCKESALIFPSGYQLNTSIFKTFLTKNDIVFCDKYVHASIIDGLILAQVPFKRFKHNDLQHLTKLLAKYRHRYNQAWVVTESLFSMEGDICPLKEIVDLKKKYAFKLYLDEAHSIGILGNGKGLAHALTLNKHIDFLTITLGKAFGAHGACIATSTPNRDRIIENCRGFIYTTGLPSYSLAFISEALNYIQSKPDIGSELLHASHSLKLKLSHLNLTITGDSHILSVRFKDTKTVLNISHILNNHKVFALPIVHPTVPKHQPRIRLSITSHHKKSHFSELLTAFKQIPCIH